MNEAWTELKARVRETFGVEDAVRVLLAGLSDQLSDALDEDDWDALEQLADNLFSTDERDAMAEAVVA